MINQGHTPGTTRLNNKLSTCTFRLDGDLGQVESDDPVERGERFGA
jgi:hypothetical protein